MMKKERIGKLRYRVLAFGTCAFILVCGYLFYMSHLLLDRSTVYMFQEHDHHPQCLPNPHPNTDNCSGIPYHITADITTHEILNKGSYKLDSDGVSYPFPTYDPIHLTTPEPLKVFIVPHSHNDPGWMKTAEEYFVDNTKHILNNMVTKLNKYPNMTFIWAETVFLSMWWSNIEDHVKANVRRLIQRGQLEIVSGGWMMPDEASTHYSSLIGQLIEGHQWLLNNLKVKPINSWSIDPFGHSATLAYLRKQAGFENMVIQRVHQATKSYLAKQMSLEFKWRQFWDEIGTEDILCHVMPYMLYNVKYSCGPDTYFCLMFDFRNIPGEQHESHSEPISDSNIEQVATYMYEQFRKKASLYKYNTLLIPLGDDFYYTKEIEWDQQYVNYEKLMAYINARKQWNTQIKFGTLTDFFVELRKSESRLTKDIDEQGKFPTLSGDFFVYSDKKEDYWSGFFTTRPFAKLISRDVQSTLNAAEMLTALKHLYRPNVMQATSFDSSIASKLQQARRLLAIFQHHDAITGTSRDVVAQNFLDKLLTALTFSQDVALIMMSVLLQPFPKIDKNLVLHPITERSKSDGLLRRKIINVSENDKFLVFFNPLMTKRREIVHIIVDSEDFYITDENGNGVFCQVNPVILGDRDHLVLSDSQFEVSFLLAINPLQIVRYKLEYTKYATSNIVYSSVEFKNVNAVKIPNDSKIKVVPSITEEVIKIKNQIFEAEFSGNDGLLMGLTDLRNHNRTNLVINFMKYKSKGSGAYILRIKQNGSPFTEYIPMIQVIRGPLFSDIISSHEVGTSTLIHKVRIFSCGQKAFGLHIENDLDIQHSMDAEVVMTVQSDFQRTTNFYTDENGFQFISRDYHDKLTTAGNFYPMTTMSFIEDRNSRVTLHSAQPLAVASLKSAEIQVLLDRTMKGDDHRGMGQGVTDNRMTKSSFVLLLEHRHSQFKYVKKEYAFPSLLSSSLNDILQSPIICAYTSHIKNNYDFNTHDVYSNPKPVSFDVKESDINVAFTPVIQPFPCDIVLVSLRNLIDNMMETNTVSMIVHRKLLDCSFPSSGVDCRFTQGVLNLKAVFKGLNFRNLTKTTLSLLHSLSHIDPNDIHLTRMEISTFKFLL